MGHRPVTFSYAELRAATEDFSSSNKLGEGGFGQVHKVNLSLHHLLYFKYLTLHLKWIIAFSASLEYFLFYNVLHFTVLKCVLCRAHFRMGGL